MPRDRFRCSLFTALALCCASGGTVDAQTPREIIFTRADTLRGMLRPERTCYDVRWYDLDVRIAILSGLR
ncbi:MAG TPA: hypothetical protein VF514_13105 [Bacteroidota bacterium]